MRRMGKAALAAAAHQVSEASYADNERSLVARINSVVHDQANKLIEMAKPMLEVNSSFL
jgi:hypothetical protein